MDEKKPRARKKLRSGMIKRRTENAWDFSKYDTQQLLNSIQMESMSDVLSKVSSGVYEARGKIHGFLNGKIQQKVLKESAFKESVKRSQKLLESQDVFGTYEVPGANSDFVPVLGGPINKQLYQTDFIKQANLAFYALNHDPFARAAVNILVDFTLGRGFRIDCKNKAALSVWRAFEKANKIPEQMEQFAREVGVYGEMMWYKLPHKETKIMFNTKEGDIPHGSIPRVRLVDPTNIWDYVTVPEDITDVQYFVWVAPTQWQTYTGLNGNTQPATKFIFQTIDAKQMLHYRVNSVSNEKRGRSDLFPILGYLKRLRDAVDYAILGQLKQSAWSIDTTVEGDQTDINEYIAEQQAIGTVPPAGSEFVHTSKIKREYMSPQMGRAGQGEAFEWTLSMISAGTGIPLSYFGTHLSGGQTRASALVSTEPFAKRCETRQLLYKRVIQDLWDYCMESFGITEECEITLPEIATQDATTKIKNTDYAVQRGYLSKRKAGNIIAKELQIDEYDYKEEQLANEADAVELAPLSAPPMEPNLSRPDSSEKENQKNSGMAPMIPMSSKQKNEAMNDEGA